MAVSMQATVSMRNDRTAEVAVRISGLMKERLGQFAKNVADKARRNAQVLDFENSSGELAGGIKYSQTGKAKFRIETTSGHASFIEFGTRFIEGKKPFLWPAYRFEKRRFFSAPKWL